MAFPNLICVVAALSMACPLAGVAEEPASPDNPFVGTWRTTSATVTLLVSIHEDGTGQFVLIDDGANACEQVTWKEMPGGILVESIPRLRFWNGRHAKESRVEMEPLPPELTSRNLQQFPLAFMMRRDDDKRQLPPEVAQRPLPEGWNAENLPDDWDAKAGIRRSQPEAQDQADAHPSPEQLRAEAERLEAMAAENLKSGIEHLVPEALHMRELAGFYRIEADLRDMHQHLLEQAEALDKAGMKAPARDLRINAIQQEAKLAELRSDRRLVELQRSQREGLREKLHLALEKARVLRTSGRFSEAAEMESEVQRMLLEAGYHPAIQRATELKQRAVDARLQGSHEDAEMYEREAERLIASVRQHDQHPRDDHQEGHAERDAADRADHTHRSNE